LLEQVSQPAAWTAPQSSGLRGLNALQAMPSRRQASRAEQGVRRRFSWAVVQVEDASIFSALDFDMIGKTECSNKL